jgi:hypothetical protein
MKKQKEFIAFISKGRKHLKVTVTLLQDIIYDVALLFISLLSVGSPLMFDTNKGVIWLIVNN